jgi:hypothetical protein
MANTKKQKREKNLKKAKKALATKTHMRNRVIKTQEPVGYDFPPLLNEHEKPAYQYIVSGFNGTMKEWYDLILTVHNEFGYGFEYDELEDVLLNLIEAELPEAKGIMEAKYDSSDAMVSAINSNFKHKFIDMLVVTNKQNGDYWSGRLELNDLITYGRGEEQFITKRMSPPSGLIKRN